MKIIEVSHDGIKFDNEKEITYSHDQDCCEYNYADFEQLDQEAINFDFDEDLIFQGVEDAGFRFGNENRRMFFIPCYSSQNGYYSSDIDVYYDGKEVLRVFCEWING